MSEDDLLKRGEEEKDEDLIYGDGFKDTENAKDPDYFWDES